MCFDIGRIVIGFMINIVFIRNKEKPTKKTLLYDRVK